MPDSTPPPTVLVVDDEPNIRELLAASLELDGFTAVRAGDAAGARESAREHGPALAVVDVMLPDGDGFALAADLRAEHPDLPVLFLTARDSVTDRVAGLRAGADDYVTKPFSVEEVVLRIRAILRRVGAVGRPDEGRVLRYEDLELDEDAYEARRGGRTIRLSPTEFELLRYLMANAGRVLTRPQILRTVWGQDGDDSRVVETYISYLRRKVDVDGPPLIHTVWGVGYSLRRSRDRG
ncbi:response regulator transcription factor [Nocardiopsis sp. EMB25]|uniref:response regulator transcription factor n=1 Tax=Nocardiopsis sp. EMB25 TaxID=2835867 RepID=UPI002284C6EF|nr:response regulator transcription factor [Nocardiopsis sp. EMB25]MCY9784733.1 response regulator transcription factor [Nocardiopsis sp. EMB25]